ncbi:MAG: DUF512 domain-containing protein [Candidatus Gastranaerophilales bacterium]
MSAIVSEVKINSIAQELEIEKGDLIVSIDEFEMIDMIDYNFMTKTDFLTLEVKKKNGEIEVIEIEKEFDEDLGIIFESAVFDRVRPCLNKCIFCFVDQQPKGLRETLYIKDDDYRLSYLQGTYITLTNFTDVDKERVKRMHLGPFYVSVHTTNPDLRVEMLKNPNAGKIMENLSWFRKNKIPFHAQIVLCPNYNDGAELERTLSDLATLKTSVLSVAIVPVGVTQFRENELVQVDKKVAVETLEIASKYKNVCCSDEFFLLAEKEIPNSKYYGAFGQLEDGVGAIRLLLDDFGKLKLPNKISEPMKVTFATSCAAFEAMGEISQKLNCIDGLDTNVIPVKSNYWGQNITVAGLITSDDLIDALKNDSSDLIVIPSIMLKPYSEDFLDGASLDYVKEATGKEFFVINNSYSIKEFVDYVTTC